MREARDQRAAKSSEKTNEEVRRHGSTEATGSERRPGETVGREAAAGIRQSNKQNIEQDPGRG